MKKIVTMIQKSIFIICLGFFSIAMADGCFFVEVKTIGNSAESPNQRALIIHDGINETLMLQVKYSGSVENFVWVVPLPSIPEEQTITTVNDSIFEVLHEMTQPKLFLISDRFKDYGSGGWDTRNQSEGEMVAATIQVWEQLQVGPYEIVVVSGSSGSVLIDWLGDRGYHFPHRANSIIDFYVQKGWYFVATRVQIGDSMSKSNSSYQSGLPAIALTFRTDKPVFPLRISELTSAKENEIELYVVTNHRMVCDNYQTEVMDPDEVRQQLEANALNREEGNSGFACACKRVFDPAFEEPVYDYESVFHDKGDSYSDPTFIVEHATHCDYFYAFSKSEELECLFQHIDPYMNHDFWVTRFRTVLSPTEMGDDVFFTPDPNGDEWHPLHIYLSKSKNESGWSTSIFGLTGIVLIPMLASKQWRRRYRRTSILMILLFLMATL